jgi:hypothetical protein
MVKPLKTNNLPINFALLRCVIENCLLNYGKQLRLDF